MFAHLIISCFLVFLLALNANAGCEPQFAFQPPQYGTQSLSKAFNLIESTLTASISNGDFTNTSFSLEIASSKQNLFRFYHTANTTTVNGANKVDGSTSYRIASNTKLFTALGLLQQQAAGNVNLDTAVNLYVTDLPKLGNIDWSSITIRALMAHLGGVPDNFAEDDLLTSLPDPTAVGLPPVSDSQLAQLPKCESFTNYTSTCTEKELMDGLQSQQPVFPPRKQSSYSNIGFNILGLVLANVTGMGYEEYISASILKPLKMDHTMFTTPAAALSVVPDSSYFGIDLGVGNPSGGLYSTSSDMIKFLQYAIKAHNKITSSMDWFHPAAYGPGSHSLIGHPWEIFRANSILVNNTRPVTFNTKGGGLAGYYSYSIIIPDYDLVVFMVVGGDDTALPGLNAIFNALRNPLVQAAEEVAQADLAQNYAGTYTAAAARASKSETYKPNVNSSMTIAQTTNQNLFIKSWISNSTDALDNFIAVTAAQSGAGSNIYFQFIPTFEVRDGSQGAVGEVWRFINVLVDDGSAENATNVWNDYCVSNIDPLSYAQLPVNEAVFWRKGGSAQMEEVELTAFGIVLGRT